MSASPRDLAKGEAQLDFWFEFASTYSYLSAMRISDAAEAAGVTVFWRPFLLGPIFAAQGWDTSPFNIYPAKGRYMWRDMERLCAQRGLPCARPTPFPQNGLTAARIAVAALQENPKRGAAFCREIYRSQFALGADISHADTVRAAAVRAGLSETSLEAAQDPQIKATLRAQTECAQEMGLFGAPSFTVGKELFWGDDRLDAALAFARTAEAEATT